MKIFIMVLLSSYASFALADLIAITPGQKLHQMVTNQTTALWTQLSNTDKAAFNGVWNNTDQANLSPCQAFAALSTDAVAARGLHVSASALMNGIVPGSNALIENPAYTLTNNQDGTVTCIAPSPSPSPSGGP